MSDFFLLVKYRLLNTTKGKLRRQTNHRKRMLVSLLYFAITLLIFSIPLFPVMLDTFRQAADETMILGGVVVSLADALFAGATFVVLCLAFVNLVPFMIHSLFDEREIGFLFSLPVRKRTILLYKAFDAFLGTFIVFSIYLPVFLAYGVAQGGVLVVTSIMAGIASIALAISLAMPFSALLSRKISRTGARRVGGVLILMNVGIFAVIFVLAAENGWTVNGFSGPLLVIGMNRFLPSTWVMRAANAELIDWALIVVLIAWLWRIGSRLADRMSLSGSTYRQGSARFARANSEPLGRLTRLRKELYSVTRAENSFFFLMYPVVFGVIMMLFTGEFLPAAVVMVLISSFYAAQLTVVSMAHESSCWPIQLSFPDSLQKAFFRKVAIVGLLFTAVYSGGLFFGFLYLQLPILYAVTIVTAFCTFFISSSLGMRFYVTSGAFSSGVQRRRLGIKATLVLEILTFLISLGNIIVLVLLIDAATKGLENGFSPFLIMPEYSAYFIGCGVPVVVSVTGILLAVRSTKNLTRRLNDERM